MSDLDKQLEELVANGHERVSLAYADALAAALLRARKVLRGKWCVWERGLCPDNNAYPESEWCPRCTALADVELEELLK